MTPDATQIKNDFHAGLISDDRVTCSECKNDIGKCRAKHPWYFPNLKQRCKDFIKK